MKFKAIVSTVLLCTFFVTIASGCNISDLGTENLLRPPKTMGDEAEIEQLISETANKSYTLKYPKSGNYRSAIVMSDLDGDGTDEAVAFFREGDDTSHIHTLVMFSDNNEWKIASDNVTETADIDSVDFADIDGSGTLEILAGYTTFSTNINRLSCYSYTNGKTAEVKAGQNYTNFYCGDFDADGVDEVMSLLLYTTENEASATMLDFSDSEKSLYSKATVAMDPGVVRYKNVVTSDFGSNVVGLVVDGTFSTEELSTQIVYYNSDMSLLRNPLFNEKSKSVTHRSCSVVSTDIDEDGIVEIPVVTKLPHTKTESDEIVADKIEWNSFSPTNETTTAKQSMIANFNYGYTFTMPDSWLSDTVTARLDAQNGTTDFYLWDKNKLGNLLFQIKTFETADWDAGKASDDYTLISKDVKYTYTFYNENIDSDYSLSDDEIKTAFSALTEIVV